MKILQLCPKSPFPPLDGGPIAMNNITQGLIEKGHEVKILAVSSPKYPVQLDKMPLAYLERTGYEYEFINTDTTFIEYLLNLFSTESLHIKRFYSKNFEKKLTRILNENVFNIIQFESIYLSPYLSVVRKLCNTKCVLRAHNIEYFVWKRLSENTGNPLKKIYLKYLYLKLKRYEMSVINKFDGIAAITEYDCDFFKRSGTIPPIEAIPVGIPHQRIIYCNPQQREFPGIFHLGSMDWLPNTEGIKWFLSDVWPLVIKKHPDIKLRLAGRNMPDWIKNYKQENVIVDGEIPSALNYMSNKSIMVAPLLSGSGMKVKIIEGMACGNTVITTPIGAEGIDVSNGENIFIVNSAAEYSEKISLCINNNSLCNKIGFNAMQLVQNKYNNFIISDKLISFFEFLMINKKKNNTLKSNKKR